MVDILRMTKIITKYLNIENTTKYQMLGNIRIYSSLFWQLVFIVITLLWSMAWAVEFTFDLADGAEDCFYEEIQRNTTAYLEFQVSSGGQLDVDVVLKNPHGRVIYEQQKATFDTHQFVADISGIYAACFSNKFSTFSHKFVYVDFQVGDDNVLPGIDSHSVLTHMETSSQSIHANLNNILDEQTHHRLREAQGRKRAEELNDRVMWWSFLETAAILVIGLGQIMILRNFFSDRKPSQSRYARL